MYRESPNTRKTISSSLAVGTTVRVVTGARSSNPFHRGFSQQNTEEIFRIKLIDKKQPIPGYILEDLSGEEISGVFYAEELVETVLPEFYPIKILRSRISKKKKQREFFVTFLGWPKKFDSWVNQSEISDINKE